MNKLLLILCLTTIIGCTNTPQSGLPAIECNNIPDSGVVINKLQIIGPFAADDRNPFLQTDNLQTLGANETTLTTDDLIRIHQTLKTSPDTAITSRWVDTGNYPVDFNKLFNTSKADDAGNVYCAAIITSKRKKKARLHFSSTMGEKIWLNQQLICDVDFYKYMTTYEQYIPIELNKGENLLLMKINKKKKTDWDMYARIENESPTAFKRQLNFFSNFSLFDTRTLKWTDTLSIKKFFPSDDASLVIYDAHNQPVLSDSITSGKRWAADLSHLPDGYYKATVTLHHHKMEQDFYKGDAIDSIAKIITQLQSLPMSNNTRNQLDALVFRYHHLQKNSWFGDHKYVTLFAQFSHILKHVQQSRDPFHHTPGLFIRAYRSPIDNSLQYYILHVPQCYQKEKPLPLMTIMPVAVGNMPYLESFRVANINLTKRFEALANAYEVMVMEFGSRRTAHPNPNTIEEVEWNNILRDIQKDYHIDTTRLYLSGACVGGNDALNMAAKYPGLFAAIGTVSPEINFATDADNPWVARHQTASMLANTCNTPILNIHCSYDRHVPVTVSRNLNTLAQSLNMKQFTYREINSEYVMYYADEYFDDLFLFCLSNRSNPSPADIDFTSPHSLYNKAYWLTLTDRHPSKWAHIHAQVNQNTIDITHENVNGYTLDLKHLPHRKGQPITLTDNGRVRFRGIPSGDTLHIETTQLSCPNPTHTTANGPLAHVLASPFIIVKGTMGSPKDQQTINALADTLNQHWHNRYFTHCHIKNDSEITPDDMKTFHLIALGNHQSNALIKRCSAQLPLQITEDAITINSQRIAGQQLNFYMVCPNPLNPQRHLAIIGYNNPLNATTGRETSAPFDISNYGWYDYKIWQANAPFNAELAGYFGGMR